MIREWNEESLDHRNTLLYAMGIAEEDAKRPIIGLVNSWNEMNPGHFPFKDVIAEMKEEIYRAGGLALELPITGICDGICRTSEHLKKATGRRNVLVRGNRKDIQKCFRI